jgi:transporter family-2 protein
MKSENLAGERDIAFAAFRCREAMREIRAVRGACTHGTCTHGAAEATSRRIQPFMNPFAYLIAIASGAANPLQSGANAELNKQIVSPLWAGIFVYASGLAGLLLAQAILRHALPTTGRLATVKAWAWLGGLTSIASTLAGITLAQKLGSGVFTGLTVTSSILTSVLLDHLGWIGFRQHSASPARLAGCALMVAGLWMVARF